MPSKKHKAYAWLLKDEAVVVVVWVKDKEEEEEEEETSREDFG